MGLPSSGLLHPGQIQIWFPHSSRIWGEGKKARTNRRSAMNEMAARPREDQRKAKPHHVGTDGLGHHTAHGRLHRRGGRQHGGRREQRQGGGRWWKGRGSRRQDGYHGGQHGWRLGHPGLTPRAGLGHRGPGNGRSGVCIWNHLTDNAVGGGRGTITR